MIPLPRLPLAAAPVVAALAFAAGAAPAGPPGVQQAIVALGRGAATVTVADGSWRAELPWLLPGDRDPAVSPDGGRLAFSSARSGTREIYVSDGATGATTRLTASPRRDDGDPAWSPDGRRLLWEVERDGQSDIFVMRADGTRKRPLVGGAGDQTDPAWSPDGRRIAFVSDHDGAPALWVRGVEGGEAERIAIEGDPRAPDWSPDGSHIAYSAALGRQPAIWAIELATGPARRLTRSSTSDLRPDWAPDGRSVAFTRASRGRTETWLVGLAGGPARRVPGTVGDIGPVWARATPLLVGSPDQRLPDLDEQAPTGLVVIARDGGVHLGFDSAVDSVGAGPLRIRGRRATGRAWMRADQLVDLAGGRSAVVPGVGTLRYEAHPPHRHWHLDAFQSYELRRASDHALVGRDRKTGFCLVDRYGRASRRVPNVAPPRFVGDCGAAQPRLRSVEQGSSPGYVDRYPAFFHGQDIDITGVPAGVYVLVHRANPDRSLRESRYANNTASARIRLTRHSGRSSEPRVVVLRRCPDSERCPAA